MRNMLFFVPCLLVLAGCEERAAEFARKTDELLMEYQKRIDAQIAEATLYYQRSATLQAFEANRVSLDNLQAERNERSTELEADFRGGRRFPELYRTYLRDYANGHYQKTVQWLSADSDAAAPYMQQLVALESDKATVDAFSKVLKNLANPRSVVEEGKDIKQFIDDTKTEFDKLLCADLKKQIAELGQAAPAETVDARAKRTEKLDTIRKLTADKKCG